MTILNVRLMVRSPTSRSNFSHDIQSCRWLHLDERDDTAESKPFEADE